MKTEKTAVEINGEVWKMYSIEYKSSDLTYSADIFARSKAEAEKMFKDLKKNGKIT